MRQSITPLLAPYYDHATTQRLLQRVLRTKYSKCTEREQERVCVCVCVCVCVFVCVRDRKRLERRRFCGGLSVRLLYNSVNVFIKERKGTYLFVAVCVCVCVWGLFYSIFMEY